MAVNADELSEITKIELRVDSESHNLQTTGELLPGLKSLKLNDSVVHCFRDLGTSFQQLRVLHLARCGLTEVQGIQAFQLLTELFLSFNFLNDLFDISMLPELEVLDLEGNCFAELSELTYLKRLTNLTDLSLRNNPVCANHEFLPMVT